MADLDVCKSDERMSERYNGIVRMIVVYLRSKYYIVCGGECELA